MMAAIQRQEVATVEDEEAIEEEDIIKPLQKVRTAPAGIPEPDGLGLSLPRRMTGQTLVDRTVTQSPESTPSVGSDEFTEYTESNMTPGLRKSSTSRKSRQLSSGSAMNQKIFPPSPLVSEEGFFDRPRRSQTEKLPSRSGTFVKGVDGPNVLEVVAEAMKELSRIRMREQSQRPLRIVPQDPVHRPDDTL